MLNSPGFFYIFFAGIIANYGGICYTGIDYTPGGVYYGFYRFSAENTGIFTGHFS
jgi:hypothetical protein